MTKKHFESLANALASERPNTADPERPTWERLVSAIARVCGNCNPRFDHDRFVDAARTR